MSYDVVIKGGTIVDGTGRGRYQGDIAIRNGRIVQLGWASGPTKLTIDARGLVVTPGFIDIHSHSDFALIANPRAESMVLQGVTTEVVGNCGTSAAPAVGGSREWVERRARAHGIDEVSWFTFHQFLEVLERRGISVNLVALVGHGTVRMSVMGMKDSKPSHEEINRMKALVAEAMEAGAFGMSTGLVYPPGRFADIEEIIQLARIVAKYGGIYASHIRGERETIVEATEEAIRIGMESGAAVQISHHPAKIGGWGKNEETLKLIDRARSMGLDVSCDLHPYTAGSTGLSALLPPWVQKGGKDDMIKLLRDPLTRTRIKQDMIEEKFPGPGPCGLISRGMWDKIYLAHCEKNKDLIGKSFKEIAELKDKDPFDAYFDLVIEEEGFGWVLGFYYSEKEIRRVLRHHTSMIGSDGYALSRGMPLMRGKMHPRSFGTFPMIIRKYVRGESREELIEDEGVPILTLEEAIMKMTSKAADKLGLTYRGRLKEGAKADVVVFDFESFSDRATYWEPYLPPSGLYYVLVNGKLVVEEGKHTGSSPGEVIRHLRLDV